MDDIKVTCKNRCLTDCTMGPEEPGLCPHAFPHYKSECDGMSKGCPTIGGPMWEHENLQQCQ